MQARALDAQLNRRAFMQRLVGLGASTAGVVALTGCRLQQPKSVGSNVPRLGVLSQRCIRSDLSWSAFRRGLTERGWTEGRNLAIDWRVYGSDLTRLPGLASELVGFPVDLIATQGSEAATAAKEATSVVPIVFCGIG